MVLVRVQSTNISNSWHAYIKTHKVELNSVLVGREYSSLKKSNNGCLQQTTQFKREEKSLIEKRISNLIRALRKRRLPRVLQVSQVSILVRERENSSERVSYGFALLLRFLASAAHFCSALSSSIAIHHESLGIKTSRSLLPCFFLPFLDHSLSFSS